MKIAYFVPDERLSALKQLSLSAEYPITMIRLKVCLTWQSGPTVSNIYV